MAYEDISIPQEVGDDLLPYVRKPEPAATLQPQPESGPVLQNFQNVLQPTVPSQDISTVPGVEPSLESPRPREMGPGGPGLPPQEVVGNLPVETKPKDFLEILRDNLLEGDKSRKQLLEDWKKAQATDKLTNIWRNSATPYTSLYMEQMTGKKLDTPKPYSETDQLLKKQNAINESEQAIQRGGIGLVAAQKELQAEQQKKTNDDPESTESEYARGLVQKMAPGSANLPSGRKLSASQIYATFPRLEAYAASENRVKAMVDEAGRKRDFTSEQNDKNRALRERVANRPNWSVNPDTGQYYRKVGSTTVPVPHAEVATALDMEDKLVGKGAAPSAPTVEVSAPKGGPQV
ncbi:MAG: hypothetical protein WCO52_06515, partial [bacterium]